MITVFLRGGLGNQMFQYAHGVHLARKNNTTLVIDTVYLQDRTPRKNFTYRNYDLDIFTITPQFSFLSRLAQKFPAPLLWLSLDMIIIKINSIAGIQKLLHEKDEYVNPDALNMSGNLLTVGYWQSEKYFRENADDVRNAFQFRIPLEGEANRIGEKILATNSVSLHVRRGDYAADKKVMQDMGETNITYYQEAARYIAQQVSNPIFFIFSDDIEWCRKKILLPFPVIYVSASSAGPKGSHHLQLMSLCKHNIIANSTFSWWGAWLNKNPYKIVIGPQKWYADNRKEGDDVIPREWIRI
ncbi:MAG: hypothetical protein RIQ54_51 [Candidatus Parcubacteria bacterium]|jgi:hypothetical protein